VSSIPSNKIINIAERRVRPRPVSIAAPIEADIERVRRALTGRFVDFRLDSFIGNVETYLVRDVDGESLSLKVLSAEATDYADARTMFVEEARAAARLAHPNVASTSEPEESQDVLFYGVEHKAGARTLREMIDHDGWLDVTTAAQIADQIASALDYARDNGVMHLRLQPECVLVEEDGWVTVADFGVDAMCGRRAELPPAHYTSPEQAAGAKVDHRSDLYSLGAILYEMLTDRTPFDSDDREFVKRKQLSFAPAAPHLISMDVSESVSNVVLKLLELQPDQRFASAVAFQSALDNAINR
jgi:eukaryotic-like serine/threonine-protein kinase